MLKFISFFFELLLVIFLFNFFQAAFADQETRFIPSVNVQGKKKKIQFLQPALTEISLKSIKESPVIKLTELLRQEQSIARIETPSGDHTQKAVSIRGFGDNAAANSLILIDGFPLTQPSLFAPNLNSLLLSDLERIDIFQGSAGTLRGNQAIGGVVNIITRHPEKKYLEMKMGMGNQNTRFYSFAASHQFNNGLFAKISGFTQKTDHYRAHNQQKTLGWFPKAGMTYAKGKIEASWQYNRDFIYFPGGLIETEYLKHPARASNFTNFSRYQTNAVQIFNQHAINTDWLVETRLQHQNLEGSGLTGLTFTRREGGDRYSPRILGSIGNKKIIMGYDGQIDYYQFENQTGFKKSAMQENDIYAQTIIPLSNEKVHFTLGSRYAHQHQQLHFPHDVHDTLTEQTWVTEQGLSFSPCSIWQIFIRRDGNFRFPKANEVLWQSQKEPLIVQTGQSYEAGSRWQMEDQTLQVTLYSLALQHEIAFDPTQNENTPFGTYYQFAKTKRRGLTLSHTHDLNDKLQFTAQVNYVQARFDSSWLSGKTIPAVPAWNGNWGLKYQWNENWAIRHAALYTGSRFASEDIKNAGKKQPAYWLHNMALQYIHGKVRTSFEVTNVWDQRYAVYTIYYPATHTHLYYPGSGRSYLLTIEAGINE